MSTPVATPAAVQALFVDTSHPQAVYPRLLGLENCWGVERDARLYAGPEPVVAHPPCARWSRLAKSVYARTGKLAHRPGNDEGCFASALESVRTYGGVLEHPAGSHAWAAHNLCPPQTGLWLTDSDGWFLSGPPSFRYWVCEVWQSAYGHPARKRTWLLYCGKRPPFELRWDRKPGTHVVGGDSKKRRALGAAAPPRLSGRQNLSTPEAFALELIRLADWSRNA